MVNRITWRANDIRANQAGVQTRCDDHRLVTGAASDEPGEDTPRLELRSTLALDAVSYNYPGVGARALRDVTLTIRHGESIGFAGATGAGKSTLVDVVMGLLPPPRRGV